MAYRLLSVVLAWAVGLELFMKIYLLSLGAGLLVGVLYGLCSAPNNLSAGAEQFERSARLI